MPGVELAFDALIGFAILSLLAIRRRERMTGDAEPAVVSVVTGVVLGIVASIVGIALIGAFVSRLV